jgi:hypothetical protein
VRQYGELGHNVIRGSRAATCCAARICRNVQGNALHPGAQEALRAAMIPAGRTGWARGPGGLARQKQSALLLARMSDQRITSVPR